MALDRGVELPMSASNRPDCFSLALHLAQLLGFFQFVTQATTFCHSIDAAVV